MNILIEEGCITLQSVSTHELKALADAIICYEEREALREQEKVNETLHTQAVRHLARLFKTVLT